MRNLRDDRPAASSPEPADMSRRLWPHPGRVRSTRAAILTTDRLAATTAAATAAQRREPRSRLSPLLLPLLLRGESAITEGRERGDLLDGRTVANEVDVQGEIRQLVEVKLNVVQAAPTRTIEHEPIALDCCPPVASNGQEAEKPNDINGDQPAANQKAGDAK
jgi:hypothetical protein